MAELGRATQERRTAIEFRHALHATPSLAIISMITDRLVLADSGDLPCLIVVVPVRNPTPIFLGVWDTTRANPRHCDRQRLAQKSS